MSIHLLETQESTVSVRLLWPFARVLSTWDPELFGLLDSAVLGPKEFSAPDGRAGVVLTSGRLAMALERSGDPLLGLRAGAALEGADLGAFGQAARSAETLQEAIQVVNRFVRLLHASARGELLVERGVAVWSFWGDDGEAPPEAFADFVIAAASEFMKGNVPGYVRPLSLLLTRPRPEHAEAYRQHFGAEVTFSASRNAVAFPAALLAAPMRHGCTALRGAFERQAARLLEALDCSPDLTRRVRGALDEQFRGGEISMQKAARSLGMSVPTLRRHLQDEGTSFKDIVDALRRDLARRHLEEAGASVSEVAYRLGFADVGSFGRAFKRWSGETPSTFRLRERAAVRLLVAEAQPQRTPSAA